jgi:thiamine-phosphate pyrophosphorylase
VKRIDWSLCLIADIEAARGKYLPDLVHKAVMAGATLVQVRAKQLDSADFFEICSRISQKLKTYSVPLIVNDRVDMALACGAEGVHLGQKDLPLHAARSLLGRKKIIGISVNSVEEAQAAESGGADYLGAGPVYKTSSKMDLPKIIGTEGIKAIKDAVNIPVLAIGGINLERAAEVAQTGVDGLAVISAVMGAQDTAAAVTALLKKFRHRQTLSRRS